MNQLFSDALADMLYPLGFLASLAFTTRFLVQWIASELKGKSIVTRAFWKLSLAGNLLLLLHSFIQSQYHVGIIQACNAVISWRNLNLMEPKEQHVTRKAVLQMLALAFFSTTLLFWLENPSWFRIPTTTWIHSPVPAIWHGIGFLGLALFASRFWVQWWSAEKQQKSTLDRPFWWLSLAGDLLCLAYFIRIGDLVNLIGPAFALIPYIRNLMLLKKQHPEKA